MPELMVIQIDENPWVYPSKEIIEHPSSQNPDQAEWLEILRSYIDSNLDKIIDAIAKDDMDSNKKIRPSNPTSANHSTTTSIDYKEIRERDLKELDLTNPESLENWRKINEALADVSTPALIGTDTETSFLDIGDHSRKMSDNTLSSKAAKRRGFVKRKSITDFTEKSSNTETQTMSSLSSDTHSNDENNSTIGDYSTETFIEPSTNQLEKNIMPFNSNFVVNVPHKLSSTENKSEYNAAGKDFDLSSRIIDRPSQEASSKLEISEMGNSNSLPHQEDDTDDDDNDSNYNGAININFQKSRYMMKAESAKDSNFTNDNLNKNSASFDNPSSSSDFETDFATSLNVTPIDKMAPPENSFARNIGSGNSPSTPPIASPAGSQPASPSSTKSSISGRSSRRPSQPNRPSNRTRSHVRGLSHDSSMADSNIFHDRGTNEENYSHMGQHHYSSSQLLNLPNPSYAPAPLPATSPNSYHNPGMLSPFSSQQRKKIMQSNIRERSHSVSDSLSPEKESATGAYFRRLSTLNEEIKSPNPPKSINITNGNSSSLPKKSSGNLKPYIEDSSFMTRERKVIVAARSVLFALVEFQSIMRRCSRLCNDRAISAHIQSFLYSGQSLNDALVHALEMEEAKFAAARRGNDDAATFTQKEAQEAMSHIAKACITAMEKFQKLAIFCLNNLARFTSVIDVKFIRCLILVTFGSFNELYNGWNTLKEIENPQGYAYVQPMTTTPSIANLSSMDTNGDLPLPYSAHPTELMSPLTGSFFGNSSSTRSSPNSNPTSTIEADEALYSGLEAAANVARSLLVQLTDALSKKNANPRGAPPNSSAANHVKNLLAKCHACAEVTMRLKEQLNQIRKLQADLEPSSVIDLQQRKQFWEGINSFVKGIIALLTSTKSAIEELPYLKNTPHLATLSKLSKGILPLISQSSYRTFINDFKESQMQPGVTTPSAASSFSSSYPNNSLSIAPPPTTPLAAVLGPAAATVLPSPPVNKTFSNSPFFPPQPTIASISSELEKAANDSNKEDYQQNGAVNTYSNSIGNSPGSGYVSPSVNTSNIASLTLNGSSKLGNHPVTPSPTTKSNSSTGMTLTASGALREEEAGMGGNTITTLHLLHPHAPNQPGSATSSHLSSPGSVVSGGTSPGANTNNDQGTSN